MGLHIARLLRGQPYDVVQVEGVEMAPYVPDAWVAEQPGKTTRPLVFDDHNAEYVLQKRAFLTDVRRPRRWVAAVYSLVQWRKLTGYERRVCRTADRVVAVSDVDTAALRRLAPELAVTVIPNGVDLEFNRPGAAPPAGGMGANALVFTGKMDYRPNVDAVIWFVTAVLPGILAEIPDARFYIVGQQPHARVQALAEHPAVTVTGRVPDAPAVHRRRGHLCRAAAHRRGTRTRCSKRWRWARHSSPRTWAATVSTSRMAARCVSPTTPPHSPRLPWLPRVARRAADLGRHAPAYVEVHFGWDAIVPRLEALYA